MMDKIMSFFRDEEGATAVEYAIMVALIAVAIIITVTALGTQIKDTFQEVIDALKGDEATAPVVD